MRQSPWKTALRSHAPISPESKQTDYLEGIRGLAALYVAVNHVVSHYLYLPSLLSTSAWWIREARYLTFGRLSVAAFIVLSGYLLARPIAQRKSVSLAFWPYIKRRIRRIGPPYWAAMVLSCAAIALLPALQSPTTPMWKPALPVTPGGVISHLFLLHDLKSDWLYQVNPPMWSVATEFQIYFFLPLILVPIWRTWHIGVAAGFGIVLGLVPTLFFSQSELLFSPWFLSLFSIGMAAATVNFSHAASMRAIEKDSRWQLASGALALIVIGMIVYQKTSGTELPWVVSEVIFGVWMASFLVLLAREQSAGGLYGWLVKLLSFRPLLWIGSFSYSIYLVHQPVLSAVAGSMTFTSLSKQLAFSLFGGMATTLVIAYLFHLAFERPFLRRRVDVNAA